MRLRFFKFLAGLATKYPRTIVIAAVALSIACGVVAAAKIKLNANLDDLVSMKLDYHRRYIEFLKEFGDEEYLYVVVDGENDMARSKKFVENLSQRLKGIPNLSEVIWKIDNPALEKNFLLYLTPLQIKSLSSMLTEGPFAVRNIASWDGFEPLFGALASRISSPVLATDEAELAQGFTFIDGLISDMSNTMSKGAPYRSRLQELFFGDGETFDPDGFYRNGNLLFVLIMPAKDFGTMDVIGKPLADIRKAIKETKEEFPEIDAGLTGRPVLSADEMETSNKDMNIATIMALVLIGAVFIIFFKGVRRPLVAMAALVMGISWTFGFVALAIGTLNILSSVFALLLIGASIEYSVYIVARYEEELSKNGNVSAAITQTLSTTGMANMTSALTTAAAFCTLLWTDFAALAQLGIISAVGIVFCLFAMLLILPAMLVLCDKKRSNESLKQVHAFAFPKMSKIYCRPGVLVAASVIIIVALLPFVRRVSFDNNLLNLQAKGLESVKYEHLILDKSRETTWFARATANTIEESHQKAREFEKLATVRKVDDVERILPEDQKKKIAAVRAMASAFAGLKFTEASKTIDVPKLMFELGRLASGLDWLQEQAFKSGRVDAVEELEKFSTKIKSLVDQIGKADVTQLLNLGALQQDFFADMYKNINILAGGMNPVLISLSDLPSNIVNRFVSSKGRYSLYIYPRENIWDPEALSKFVSDIRKVDPGVLGTPIEVHESGNLMRKTFARSAVLAFFVICLLVWLDFRTLRASLLAIIPLVTGMLWLFGAMGLLGIQFNMANFFAIPILIGTGVDFGVQIVHRLRQERSFKALGASTGKALLMTAIANGIGFGSMMIAHHRGLASLGQILAMGCVFCLVAAIVPTPPLAKWLKWGYKN